MITQILKNNKIHYNVKSYNPPGIADILNKKYICAGNSNMLGVENNIENEDITWIPENESVYAILGLREEKFQVKSSSGKDFYEVLKITYPDNTEKWNCTCVGFQFHANCKHVKNIKN